MTTIELLVFKRSKLTELLRIVSLFVIGILGRQYIVHQYDNNDSLHKHRYKQEIGY